MRFNSIILFLFITFSLFGQVNDSIIRQQVLDHNIVDSLFVFGKWDNLGQTETHLRYIGNIKTKDHKILRFINSSIFWGLSKHATSNILIFNEDNELVGLYNVPSTNNLPDKISEGKLIFTNKKNEGCDNLLITEIDFTIEIPKQIFIRCEGDNGDLFVFSINK